MTLRTPCSDYTRAHALNDSATHCRGRGLGESCIAKNTAMPEVNSWQEMFFQEFCLGNMFRAREICKHLFYKHLDRPNWDRVPVVQSLNSPFFPPHIGAEPGRAKEESRIICIRMLRTPPSPGEKKHIWKYFPDLACGAIF